MFLNTVKPLTKVAKPSNLKIKKSMSIYSLSRHNITGSEDGWKQNKITAIGFPMNQHSEHFYKLGKHFYDFPPISINNVMSFISIPHKTPNKSNNAYSKYYSQFSHGNQVSKRVYPNGKIFLVGNLQIESVGDILLDSINGPKLNNDNNYYQKELIKTFLIELGIDITLPAINYLGELTNCYKIEKDYYGVSEHKDPYTEWLTGKNLSTPYEDYINYYTIGIL